MTGADLRAFRERHGLNHSECARLLGITQPAVTQAERRRSRLSGPVVRLIELADASPVILEWMRRFADVAQR